MVSIEHLRTLISVIFFHAVLSHLVFLYIRGNEWNCNEFLQGGKSSCSFHQYTKEEARKCLEPKAPSTETRIYFIGDSHMRFLAMALLKIIGCNINFKRHEDNFVYCKKAHTHVNLNFRISVDANVSSLLDMWKAKDIHSDLVIENCMLWPVKRSNGTDEARHEFRTDLTKLAGKLDILAQTTPVVWYFQPPIIESKRARNQMNLTNQKIDMYNQVIKEVLSPSHVNIWYAARETAANRVHAYSDPTHIGRKTETLLAQHILNYLCNRRFDFKDGTCCNSGRLFSAYDNKYLLLIIYVCASPLILITSWIVYRILSRGSLDFSRQYFHIDASNTPAKCTPHSLKDVLSLGMKLSLLLCTIYLIARTPLFLKDELSSYSHEFLLYGLLFVMAGMVSLQTLTKEHNLMECYINETKGLLVSLLFISQWFKFSYTASLMESLLLVTSGIEFYKSFFVENNLSYGHIFKKVSCYLAFVITLKALMVQAMQQYPLFLLFMINFIIAYLIFLIPLHFPTQCKTQCSTFTIMLKILLIIMLNSMIFLNRKTIFEHGWINYLFSNREGTLKEWMRDYNKNAYSFCEGLLVGFVLYECVIKNMPSIAADYASEAKVNPYKEIIVLLISIGSIGYSICLLKLGWESFLLPNIQWCLTIAGYLMMRYIFAHWKPVFSSFYTGVGRIWLGVYLLYKNIALPYDGNAVILYFPFNQYANFFLVFGILLTISSYLKEILDFFY